MPEVRVYKEGTKSYNIRSFFSSAHLEVESSAKFVSSCEEQGIQDEFLRHFSYLERLYVCVFIYIYNSCISAQGSETHSSECLQDRRKIPTTENKNVTETSFL